jgi:hypothetical protein
MTHKHDKRPSSLLHISSAGDLDFKLPKIVPDIIPYTQLKRHYSKIHQNIKINSDVKNSKKNPKNPVKQDLNNISDALKAPRLMPDHKIINEPKKKVNKPTQIIIRPYQKPPIQINKRKSYTKYSLFDKLNKTNDLKLISEKLGHKSVTIQSYPTKSKEIYEISQFFNRTVYDSTVKIPKIPKKTKKPEVSEPDKSRNLTQYFNSIIKEFDLNPDENDFDDCNIFDLYLSKES